MKKILLLIGFVFFSISFLTAQENIEVSIENTKKKGIHYIKVKIINKNPYNIILFTNASYLKNGQIGTSLPSTYMQLVGNPFTTGNGGNSGPNRQKPRSIEEEVLSTNILSEPIVFSGTIGSTGANIRKAMEIKAGETYVDAFPLFGVTTGPDVGYLLEQMDNIETIQLKLKLSYYYLGDKKRHKLEVLSNTLNIL